MADNVNKQNDSFQRQNQGREPFQLSPKGGKLIQCPHQSAFSSTSPHILLFLLPLRRQINDIDCKCHLLFPQITLTPKTKQPFQKTKQAPTSSSRQSVLEGPLSRAFLRARQISGSRAGHIPANAGASQGNQEERHSNGSPKLREVPLPLIKW